MTRFFQEYENKRLKTKKTTFPEIGKKFYWCKSLKGDMIPRKSFNEIVVNSHKTNSLGEIIIRYQYLIDGLPGELELSSFIDCTTPLDD